MVFITWLLGVFKGFLSASKTGDDCSVCGIPCSDDSSFCSLRSASVSKGSIRDPVQHSNEDGAIEKQPLAAKDSAVVGNDFSSELASGENYILDDEVRSTPCDVARMLSPSPCTSVDTESGDSSDLTIVPEVSRESFSPGDKFGTISQPEISGEALPADISDSVSVSLAQSEISEQTENAISIGSCSSIDCIEETCLIECFESEKCPVDSGDNANSCDQQVRGNDCHVEVIENIHEAVQESSLPEFPEDSIANSRIATQEKDTILQPAESSLKDGCGEKVDQISTKLHSVSCCHAVSDENIVIEKDETTKHVAKEPNDDTIKKADKLELSDNANLTSNGENLPDLEVHKEQGVERSSDSNAGSDRASRPRRSRSLTVSNVKRHNSKRRSRSASPERDSSRSSSSYVTARDRSLENVGDEQFHDKTEENAEWIKKLALSKPIDDFKRPLARKLTPTKKGPMVATLSEQHISTLSSLQQEMQQNVAKPSYNYRPTSEQ